ncbi:glycosyl transferase group 1 [Stackebrandtia nassauensis DSM 44728]|uniref:Glycosyl transferase group 1 n=2 Tax=Stackebrandtia TaxID=283810 RepID=D3Q3J4_STANL|nr:glycosyl transferase group 1 [Stackebrandtia nassauensis DSM 44728]
MLSWEYPPVLVGGLGRSVHALATALAAEGHDVTVATRHGDHPDGSAAAFDETVDGVRVVRAPQDPPLFPFTGETLLEWTMAFNHSLTRTALRACRTQDFDVIHAHDWLVTHAAVTLKHHLDLPLVATIHSTEAGRHHGWLPDDTSRAIHSIEWWLTYESRRVLVCSKHMRWEVNRLFELPEDKTLVVPNGVDARVFAVEDTVPDREAGPVVVSAGRLVHEKGVQDLIDAAAILREKHPGLRVLIAGEGPHEEELRDQAVRRGLEDTVEFLGFVEGAALPRLLGGADCFAIPSRYEPFGMVALEAAAAGTPVVAGRSGGLAEFIVDGETGLTHTPARPEELAEAISRVLSEPELARRLRDGGRAMVSQRFGWGPIATAVIAAYAQSEIGERAVEAELAARELRVVIPEGNLLDAG